MIKNGRPVTVEADSNTIDAALLYALPDEKSHRSASGSRKMSVPLTATVPDIPAIVKFQFGFGCLVPVVD